VYVFVVICALFYWVAVLLSPLVVVLYLFGAILHVIDVRLCALDYFYLELASLLVDFVHLFHWIASLFGYFFFFIVSVVVLCSFASSWHLVPPYRVKSCCVLAFIGFRFIGAHVASSCFFPCSYRVSLWSFCGSLQSF